jgi:hypothetical protein
MVGDRFQPLVSFISDLGLYPEETVHFIHVMLPHRPFQYLPSGRAYTNQKDIKGLSFMRESTTKVVQGQQLLADRFHQRHLLQTAYVDGLLGRLISAMKSAEIYAESLLIVVADHGISYQQNMPIRYPMQKNFGEVAFVPLFIKYPFQDRARELDMNAETIDILPTIIDVLGIKTTWKFDGQSLLDERRTVHEKKILLHAAKQLYLVYSQDEYLAARQDALEKNISTFSLDDPRSDLFHFGPGLELIGTPVDILVNDRVPCSLQSDMIGELGHVNLSKNFLPTGIEGEISCIDTNLDQVLLLAAVNGVIRGITSPYTYKDEGLFNLILSDQVLQDGANDIELFVILKKL